MQKTATMDKLHVIKSYSQFWIMTPLCLSLIYFATDSQ